LWRFCMGPKDREDDIMVMTTMMVAVLTVL